MARVRHKKLITSRASVFISFHLLTTDSLTTLASLTIICCLLYTSICFADSSCIDVPRGGNSCTDNSGLGLGVLGQVCRPPVLPQVDVGTPLGFQVSMALKEKIWQGMYIDMSLLLNDSSASVFAKAGDTTANLSLAIVGGNLVVRKPEGSRKKLDTFEEWQSAFHNFMAIFLVKHPNRCGELLKYCEIIHMAAVQFPGQGWKRYDEQFRLRGEADPMRFWGKLDTELWLPVAAVGVTAASQFSSGNVLTVPQPSSSKVRTGLCFAYNGTQGCHFRVCKFLHTCSCSKCQRPGHGATRCRMAGHARWVSSPATAASAPPARPHKLPALPAQKLADPMAMQKHYSVNLNRANVNGASGTGTGSFRSSNAN